MIKKILIYVVLVLVFCSGCSKTTNNSNNEKNELKSSSTIYIKDNKDIVTETGVLPSGINIIGKKDENSYYYITTERKNIYLYNLLTKNITIFSQSTNPEHFIKQTAISDDWLVWVEDKDLVETSENRGLGWKIYAKNLKTNDTFVVDEYKKLNINPKALSLDGSPRRISLSNDKIVYTLYDELKDKSVARVIKLYNLTEKKGEIIDTTKDYIDGFYSYPSIYNDNVVWSYSICDKNFIGEERGKTYLYNVKRGKKEIISGTSTEILWPEIYENYVVARCKTNGENTNSKIVLKNIAGKYDWVEVAGPESEFYNNYVNVETSSPQIASGYIIWSDNKDRDCLVYSIKSGSVYRASDVNDNKNRIITDGLFDNTLLWYEVVKDDNGKQKELYKYAKLK